MFLREKKVGKAAYVQLVQSTRTAQGPRSKVVASLGRSDDPKTKMTLQRLAERSASLSGLHLNGSEPDFAAHMPNDQGSDGLDIPLLVEPAALKRLIMKRALGRSGLTAHAVRLFHRDDSGLGHADPEAVSVVASAVAGVTFACPDLLAATDFAAMPDVNALPTALATVLTRGNSEDDVICVHIGRCATATDAHNLLGSSVFAVAVNGQGRLLMCVHWPDFAGLIDMIARHVETMLYAMPGRRLTLHLDPNLFGAERMIMLKRAVLAIHASHVHFITPLHEPSRLMSSVPEEIFEQRPEMPPIEDVKDLRYLRLPDSSLVYAEQAARQVRVDALDTWDNASENDARKRDLIRKRLDASGEWDGTTLLMTNSRADRRSIAQTYLMALTARDFLNYTGKIGQTIFNHGNLPRNGKRLMDTILALGLLGRAALADALARPSMDGAFLDEVHRVSALKLGQGRHVLTGDAKICALLKTELNLTAADFARLPNQQECFANTNP
ncbi:MAG: hypothetical protein AAFQ10_13275 [Pseudomonadota bacterium]